MHPQTTYHTTHALTKSTTAYSTYSAYLVLEADQVEEAHCGVSPFSDLTPSLNFIATKDESYRGQCLVIGKYALDVHQLLTAPPILESGVGVHPTEEHLRRKNYTTCHPFESAHTDRGIAHLWMAVKECWCNHHHQQAWRITGGLTAAKTSAQKCVMVSPASIRKMCCERAPCNATGNIHFSKHMYVCVHVG